MTALVLDIRAGEHLMINGADIYFASSAKIGLLTKDTRFLFGKQIMRLEDATTPLRCLRYASQQAYVGPDDKRREHLMRAVLLAETIGPEAMVAADLARDDAFYAAIKTVRALIVAEETRLASAGVAA